MNGESENLEHPPELEPTTEQESENPQSEAKLLAEKYDDLHERHLRLMAEYDNYRKRSAREKEETYGSARACVLQKLLSVQDNFERARQYDPGSEEFAKGIEMIEKSFSDTLNSFGVKPFGDVGETFDPEKHHAVMHIEDEALGENVVAGVLQKGYMMGDKVLRHAMVQTAN